MSDLTLLIPAKNEKESLPHVLNELKKFSYKIKIILHPSDKDTIEVLSGFDVDILYQKNYGYGDALIEGINNCKTELFCIFNADGSFNPSEIEPMLLELKQKKLDLIFASRYQDKSGSEDDTVLTKIGNFFFTFLSKILFKLNISDILYTFVIGQTKNVKSLNIKKKDFRFCVELPIKAKFHNLKIASIGSYERKRIAGKKKVNEFKDGFLILIEILRLFFFNE